MTLSFTTTDIRVEMNYRFATSFQQPTRTVNKYCTVKYGIPRGMPFFGCIEKHATFKVGWGY